MVELGGSRRCLLTAKAPLANASGWATQVLSVTFDVTELRQEEADSARSARLDRLTGLANATSFQERAEEALQRAPGAQDLGPAARRPRPLQGCQRRLRPGVRGRPAAGGGPAPA
jgi:hypothetical protein